VAARRAIYECLYGNLPPLAQVKSACGLLVCVNPRHAFVCDPVLRQMTAQPKSTVLRPEPNQDEWSVDELADIIVTLNERSPTVLAECLSVPVKLVSQALELL